MKHFFNSPSLWLPLAAGLIALLPSVALATDAPAENIVVLDEVAVRNLGIQTVEASPRPLEQTAFALGVIEPRPESVAVVASRIPGRVVGLEAFPADTVQQGAVVARVESRLPGSPPQVVDLVAPLGGTVSTLDVRLGDPVEPDRPLMQIADLSEVLAVARVPEHLAARIEAGAQARIRIPALGNVELEGRLLRFGTLADAASGTVNAYFALPNKEHRIVPGMRAEFAIVLGQKADVVSVPRIAVQGQGGSRFVFVSHFDLPNAFVKAPVVLGQSNDRYVEIVSGLFPGDEVVTTGAYALSFAGAGSMSLKEALDAAHGHSHNEDGSEISDKGGSGGHDDDHAHGGSAGSGGMFWKIVSAVLFVALLASLWGRKSNVRETQSDAASGGAAGDAAAHGVEGSSAADASLPRVVPQQMHLQTRPQRRASNNA